MGHRIAQKQRQFMLGNEAIAWAAIENGVNYVAGYPGTPSSEIVQELAKHSSTFNLHVEWSANEKVAAEGAAAAAVSGLYSLVAMKNAGLSVALDFLTHLSLTGIGGGGGAMLAVVCDDPDAHSSGDETDSRWLARFGYMPLVEPSTIEEAKRLVRWAFELSSELACHVLYRSYTRLSHTSSLVAKDEITRIDRRAYTDATVSMTPYLAKPAHAKVLGRLEKVKAKFERSQFNQYSGPEAPEMMVVCSGSAVACTRDTLESLELQSRVGILKLVTLWPFPKDLVLRRLKNTRIVLVAEEVDPFVEVHVKSALAEASINGIKVLGKESGHIPSYGEITPDLIQSAVSKILCLNREIRPTAYQITIEEKVDPILITRGLAWCPGCPHRASFYVIDRALKADGRKGYLTGDIGCYTLDVFPGGKHQMNLLHAMGSGAGLASGLGQLGRFGYEQPVISVCGDSTFFHASIPALINAVHNGSHFLQVVLDNQATAMTGFQPHPGTGTNAMGDSAQKVDIESLCRSIGCKVTVSDPFDIKGTVKTIRRLLKEGSGLNVLIMRRACELVRMKQEKSTPFVMKLDPERCKGVECNICLTKFRCPGLVIDPDNGKVEIRKDICSGCSVCEDICPFGAITKKDAL